MRGPGRAIYFKKKLEQLTPSDQPASGDAEVQTSRSPPLQCYTRECTGFDNSQNSSYRGVASCSCHKHLQFLWKVLSEPLSHGGEEQKGRLGYRVTLMTFPPWRISGLFFMWPGKGYRAIFRQPVQMYFGKFYVDVLKSSSLEFEAAF